MKKLLNKIPSLLAAKEMRENKRYTQRDMAQETDLTESLVSRTMRNEVIDTLSLIHAHAIADWLECSIYDLFEASETDADDSSED